MTISGVMSRHGRLRSSLSNPGAPFLRTGWKIETAPSGAGQFRCQILLIQGGTKLVWTLDREPRGPTEGLVCVPLRVCFKTK